MTRALGALLLTLTACGGSHHATPAHVAKPAPEADPDGPHRAGVVAQVQPYLDGELVDSAVVAIYDGGKREIYGFARRGTPVPNGRTLFELGGVTHVYTALLFADGIQRKEVELDTPVSEAMPPGVTVPTQDNQAIVLRDLALNASGMAPQPPRVELDAPDPYAHYSEDLLYADLVGARLDRAPGRMIVPSIWGYGLLGVALGRKLDGGVGYAKIVRTRVLDPLELHDTFVDPPDAVRARAPHGTNEDLQPVPAWHWSAMVAAGGMVGNARDLLVLIDDELDALAGGKHPLREAMRFSQKPALERTGDNVALGWQIDSEGRYWQSGRTRGFHAFVGFDPKTRRGVVVLASTGLSILNQLSDALYHVLANEPATPPVFSGADQLAHVVGTYDLSGAKLQIVPGGKRLYLQGPGAPPMRLVPINDHELWVEQLQSAAVFQVEGNAIKAMVFFANGKELRAARVESAPPPAPAAPSGQPAGKQ